ncbi:hypothetical protein H1C71_033468, partial [Ictidomys tridecemlineatus]
VKTAHHEVLSPTLAPRVSRGSQSSRIRRDARVPQAADRHNRTWQNRSRLWATAHALLPAKEGAGSRRGGHLQGQSKSSAPALRAGGPSLTLAVGGGGGASREATEGAGPAAWRRGLGLSVRARRRRHRGSLHAVALVAASSAASRSPSGIPSHLPCPGPALRCSFLHVVCRVLHSASGQKSALQCHHKNQVRSSSGLNFATNSSMVLIKMPHLHTSHFLIDGIIVIKLNELTSLLERPVDAPKNELSSSVRHSIRFEYRFTGGLWLEDGRT